MKYCPECGKQLKETSKFCSSCGYESGSSHETPKRKTADIDEDTFECEHCGKSFTNETTCLRHEKNCYAKPSSQREDSRHDIVHEVVIHKKSNAGVIVVVIIILVIAAIILMGMYGQQQHAASFSGQTESLIDKIFGW